MRVLSLIFAAFVLCQCTSAGTSGNGNRSSMTNQKGVITYYNSYGMSKEETQRLKEYDERRIEALIIAKERLDRKNALLK